jgi:hypothetical protein
MDSIHFIGVVHDLWNGSLSWFQAWTDSGNAIFHLIVIAIEWLFWGMNSKITVLISALVWGYIFLIYVQRSCQIFSQAIYGTSNLYSLFFIQLASAFIFFSPAGWEIWLLDLGLPQILKNLIIVLLFLKLSDLDYKRVSALKTVFLGISVSVINLLITAQWSYAVASTVIVVSILLFWRAGVVLKSIFLILPVFVGQFIFIAYTANGSSVGSMAVSFDLDGLFQFIAAVLYGAASVFIGNETVSLLGVHDTFALLVGALFLFVVFLNLLAYCILVRENLGSFYLFILIFGLFVLGSIGFGRGGLGFHAAAASRYFMDYQFMFFGYIGICLFLQVRMSGPGHITFGTFGFLPTFLRVSMFLFVSLAVTGHFLTYINEYRKAPYRALNHAAQAKVYGKLHATEEDARLLQTNVFSLDKALPIIRDYRLGSLREKISESK